MNRPSAYMDFRDALVSCLNSQTVTMYQHDLVRRCFRLDSEPYYTVLQDKDSPYMFGSYNAGVVLFTATFTIFVFLVYSFDITALIETFGGNSDMAQTRDRKITMLSFLLSILLVIILTVFAFRTQNTNPYDNHVPMSAATGTLCLGFALLLVYYFGMELWEQKNLEKFTGNTQMRLDIMYPANINPKLKRLTLVVFPWAESSVFVDALLIIGLLGLQPDNMTTEVTSIFQATVYASFLTVLSTYDHYEYKEGVKDDPYIMAFLSHVAVLLLQLIPWLFILMRFSSSVRPDVDNMLIAYTSLVVAGSIFKVIWHIRHRKLTMTASQVFWFCKVTVQIVFVLIIFFMALNYYKLNDTLTSNASVWLANW